MGYSKYKKIRQVVDKFGIEVFKVALLNRVSEVQPSAWLTRSLEIAYEIALSNEKVKSERLISPVLAEIHLLHKHKISLFSDEELNVQVENDLNGACDFFFSLKPNAYLLEAPIISLTEAKNEDLDYGIAQCAAQMIAARLFNAQSNHPTPVIWGCATTAIEWRLLKLEEQRLYIDVKSYSIDNLPLLLGLFTKS